MNGQTQFVLCPTLRLLAGLGCAKTGTERRLLPQRAGIVDERVDAVLGQVALQGIALRRAQGIEVKDTLRDVAAVG